MGNKSHATGMRLGINVKHIANWYASKQAYSTTILNDIKLLLYNNKDIPLKTKKQIECS